MTDLQCPMGAFTRPESSEEIQGINLVYLVDRPTAHAGETLTFTAWILNSTAETLTNVCLLPRSLTNGDLDGLAYTEIPTVKELTGRMLGPRQSLCYSMSYKVTDVDAENGGMFTSAVQAELSSHRFGLLVSECDALSVMEPGTRTRRVP